MTKLQLCSLKISDFSDENSKCFKDFAGGLSDASTCVKDRKRLLRHLCWLQQGEMNLVPLLRFALREGVRHSLDELDRSQPASWSGYPTNDFQRVFEFFLRLVERDPGQEDLKIAAAIGLLDPRWLDKTLRIDGVSASAARMVVESGNTAGLSDENWRAIQELGHADPEVRHHARLRRWGQPFDAAMLETQYEKRRRDGTVQWLSERGMNPFCQAQPAPWDSSDIRREVLELVRKRDAIERCPGCKTPVERLAAVPLVSCKRSWNGLCGRAGWFVGCPACRIQLGWVLSWMN